MRRQRAMILWAMVATVLPVAAAYAADAKPIAPSAAVKVSPPNPAPGSVPFVPQQGLRLDSKPAGLTYKVEVPASASRPDVFRFDLVERSGTATAAGLNLTPVVNSSRTGWHISGRAGPVRWLTPLDGRGDTQMRLGGRLPGQPRVPGTGTISISIHYAFE